MLASIARLLVVLAVLLLISAPAAADAAAPAAIQFTRFDSATDFGGGAFNSTLPDGDRIVLAPGALSGTWAAPSVQPRSSFSRLVASWNADTPAAGRVTVEAQVTTAAGDTSDWYTLGIWAADDQRAQRTSVPGQADALGRVATDTLYARADPFVSYSLRVRLQRASADDPSPGVHTLGAETADYAYSAAQPTSTPLSSDPVELGVPPLSQEIHAHQYPQWGGGGEAWCSPTSTEMVVEFWGRGPNADDLAWVDPRYADPSVDFAARATYDAAYRGTGNWPFNAAYAARFGLDTFVTQLRSLAEAEQFVRAGIPVVTSIASRPGELDGFLFSGGTNGHLVVVVGFDAAGNPIVNDPASLSDATVRHAYDRAQFERVWLRGSGGTAYIIHPASVALPPPPPDATPNW
ncbi:MAG: C39 family peptidase [Chloroflexi bacterium]|nr:C39 family peptidase [Chloroflexota bacterium]